VHADHAERASYRSLHTWSIDGGGLESADDGPGGALAVFPLQARAHAAIQTIASALGRTDMSLSLSGSGTGTFTGTFTGSCEPEYTGLSSMFAALCG
jgi:hypothetical protein